jgi:hypothetical protein
MAKMRLATAACCTAKMLTQEAGMDLEVEWQLCVLVICIQWVSKR